MCVGRSPEIIGQYDLERGKIDVILREFSKWKVNLLGILNEVEKDIKNYLSKERRMVLKEKIHNLVKIFPFYIRKEEEIIILAADFFSSFRNWKVIASSPGADRFSFWIKA
jgi:hypothetical protein